MAEIWIVARHDLLLWRRLPIAVLSALLPPVGMTLLLVMLSLTVGQQPVALVVLDHGPQAVRMQQIIEADSDAFELIVTDAKQAQQLLNDEEVTAIITIPANFDQRVQAHQALLEMKLNNIDIDFGDDIRRSVARSAAEFDAPALGLVGETSGVTTGPNPYQIDIHEHNLRVTDVDFLHYQILPALVLLVLNVGLLGTALLCARDSERGTARHLLLAPLSPWALIAGRLLGGTLAALIALVPALLLCILFGVVAPPADHWPALMALFLATALCASGLGAVVGTVLRGSRTVTLAAAVLATYLFFLGGGFTTIAFLPGWLRAISAFNPIRYAIDGLRQALFYPNLLGVPLDLVVLLITALAAIGAGTLSIRSSWHHAAQATY